MLRLPINPRTGEPTYQANNPHRHYESGLRKVVDTVNDRLPNWNVDQMEKQMSSPKKK